MPFRASCKFLTVQRTLEYSNTDCEDFNRKKKSVIYAVLFSSEYFCVYSGLALAYWQGYRMYRSGEVPDVGKVFTVVLSVLIAASSMTTIAPQYQTFTNASSAATELFEVLDKPSELDPLSLDGKTPAECHGQIEVSNLNFSYPSRPGVMVLKSLSLSIPAGKTTALVGASGCGKSTLVGLLERWYEADSGSIMVDGDDITHYNTRWLRKHVGLVQQVRSNASILARLTRLGTYPVSRHRVPERGERLIR